MKNICWSNLLNTNFFSRIISLKKINIFRFFFFFHSLHNWSNPFGSPTNLEWKYQNKWCGNKELWSHCYQCSVSHLTYQNHQSIFYFIFGTWFLKIIIIRIEYHHWTLWFIYSHYFLSWKKYIYKYKRNSSLVPQEKLSLLLWSKYWHIYEVKNVLSPKSSIQNILWEEYKY